MANGFTIFLERFRRAGPIVPIVRLSGIIGGSRTGLSLAVTEKALKRAFGVKKAPAVALIVNSPGGSAVQSHLIFKRVRALAEEKHKHVIVAVEDVAASGGYMIAAAAAEIVVDPSSIVGSIGVVSAGFGFQKLIEKIGVERRVHTAGESKSMLDPFRPEREDDVARLKAIQSDVHAMFIDLVRQRRASLASDPDLFSGAFWSGSRAVELGLADRVGDLRSVLRERYGENVRVLPIAVERKAWLRRLGLSADTDIVDDVIVRIEERLLMGRFGM
jgi:signal peptide peptidase SppA